jgi:hypothetical protein
MDADGCRPPRSMPRVRRRRDRAGNAVTVQRMDGGTVILQGITVIRCAAMVDRGVRAARRDGIAPSPDITALAEVLTAAARHVMQRQHDVVQVSTPQRSDQEIGSAQAAAILHLGIRQVQRIARSLGGRRTPSGTWAFDSDTVTAYALERQDAMHTRDLI